MSVIEQHLEELHRHLDEREQETARKCVEIIDGLIHSVTFDGDDGSGRESYELIHARDCIASYFGLTPPEAEAVRPEPQPREVLVSTFAADGVLAAACPTRRADFKDDLAYTLARKLEGELWRFRYNGVTRFIPRNGSLEISAIGATI